MKLNAIRANKTPILETDWILNNQITPTTWLEIKINIFDFILFFNYDSFFFNVMVMPIMSLLKKVLNFQHFKILV